MFKINNTDEALVIGLPDKIDNQVSMDMEQTIIENVNNTDKPVVFNFKGNTFICSHFLKVLLKSLNAVGKERFKMENLSPEIRRVFKIAGFDNILK